MTIIPGLPPHLATVPPAPRSHDDPNADGLRADWKRWRWEVMLHRAELHRDLSQDPGLRKFEIAKCAQHPAYWASMYLLMFEPRWRVDANEEIPDDPEADDPDAEKDGLAVIPAVPLFTHKNLMANVDAAGAFDPVTSPIFGWIPFIPFADQVDVMNKLLWTLYQEDEHADAAWSKCRGWGASWIGCLLAAWGFTFSDQWATPLPWNPLLLSRKEEYVDSKQQKSLFWKLRKIILNTPEWQLPQGVIDNNLIIQNPANGNQITGESTNSNVGRGDRNTFAWIDEAAAIPDLLEKWATLTLTTDHRWGVSTESFELGRDFYDLHNKDSDEGTRPLVIESNWWSNPLNDDAWLARQKKRFTLREHLFQQEIWRNPFMGSTLVYDWADKLTANPEIAPSAGLSGYLAIDPGFRDPTAIVAVQEGAGDELYVLDSYAERGKEADYYVPLLKPEVFTAIDPHWQDRDYLEWTSPESDVTFAYQTREIAFATVVAKLGRVKYIGDTYGETMVGSNSDSVYSRWRKYGIRVNADRKTGDGVTQTVKIGRTHKGRQEAMHELQTRWKFAGTTGARIALKALKENSFPPENDGTAQTEPRKPIHDWTSHYVSAMEYLAVHIRQRVLHNKRVIATANRSIMGGGQYSHFGAARKNMQPYGRTG